MDLNKMQLPKVNQRKQQSRKIQTLLALEIEKAIERIEVEHQYSFESFEVDNVLLDIVKRNHESYLTGEFGYDAV